MASFEVGMMYEEGLTEYDEEIRFDVAPSGLVLSLFFNKTSSKEIESITSGRLELGFYERREEGVIFFLAKFAGMTGMDAAYSVYLSNDPDSLEVKDSGVELQIVLVNAKRGDIRAVRTVELPDRFSQKLKRALEEQKAKPWDAVKYYQTIGSLYDNFTTKDFVKRADAVCRFK